MSEFNGKLSLPRPFKDLATKKATSAVSKLTMGDLNADDRATLLALQNQGKITITETHSINDRGPMSQVAVSDLHQLIHVGQETAAGVSTVQSIAVVQRDSHLKGITTYYSAAPGAGESITVTLTRNGESILNEAYVINDSSTGTSQAGVPLAGDSSNTDGETFTADTDKFKGASATFTDAHIGNLVLLNNGNANDGLYRIDTRIDGDNVTVTDLDGTDPGFISATTQKWDMYLNLKPGDMLNLKAVTAGAGLSIRWCTQVVLQPR